MGAIDRRPIVRRMVEITLRGEGISGGSRPFRANRRDSPSPERSRGESEIPSDEPTDREKSSASVGAAFLARPPLSAPKFSDTPGRKRNAGRESPKRQWAPENGPHLAHGCRYYDGRGVNLREMPPSLRQPSMGRHSREQSRRVRNANQTEPHPGKGVLQSVGAACLSRPRLSGPTCGDAPDRDRNPGRVSPMRRRAPSLAVNITLRGTGIFA